MTIRSSSPSPTGSPYDRLDDFFPLSEESDARFTHTVAWVDGLSSGRALGRGLFMRGSHASADAARRVRPRGRRGPAVPFVMPDLVLSPRVVRLFNAPMTAALPKNPLFASARSLGREIQRAMRRGRPDVLYVPWYWRWIMLVIRNIPRPIFRRLSL
jgi:hypothetical protein